MISKEFLIELRKYVHKHTNEILVRENTCLHESYVEVQVIQNDMADYINKKKKPSFNKLLFKYIDKSGMSDAEVYKKAGLDRRLFSKIRSNTEYHPGKSTAIALALALELDTMKTEELIETAGYSLSDSETFDLVITYCIENKVFNINDVNMALDYFSLKPLTGVIE